MPKFIISWDIGYGRSHEIIDARDLDMARMAAYEQAREEFENSADYDSEPYTEERAKELEIE